MMWTTEERNFGQNSWNGCFWYTVKASRTAFYQALTTTLGQNFEKTFKSYLFVLKKKAWCAATKFVCRAKKEKFQKRIAQMVTFSFLQTTEKSQKWTNCKNLVALYCIWASLSYLGPVAWPLICKKEGGKIGKNWWDFPVLALSNIENIDFNETSVFLKNIYLERLEMIYDECMGNKIIRKTKDWNFPTKRKNSDISV